MPATSRRRRSRQETTSFRWRQAGAATRRRGELQPVSMPLTGTRSLTRSDRDRSQQQPLPTRSRQRRRRGDQASSAPRCEPVAAASPTVDVLDLAVRAPAAVLERRRHRPPTERDLVPTECRQQREPSTVEPVDIGRRAERGTRPQHERRLRVLPVAEVAGLYPGESVAAARSAQPPVRSHPNRKTLGLDNRNPPRGALHPAPAATAPVEV